jgi:hypothetical protein
VIFGFAHALDVYLFRLSEFTTVLALSNRATLLLYLEKRAICVFAGRGTMTFNTSFAVRVNANERTGEPKNIGKAGRKDIPSIFFVTDENLNDRRASWGGEGRVRKKAWTGVGEEEGTVPLCVKLRGLDRSRSPGTKVRLDLSTNAQRASVIGTGRRTC